MTTRRDKRIRVRRRELMRKTQLRLATWNVDSWNTRNQDVMMEIAEKNIDICSIQETKKKGKGSQLIDNYIFIYSGKNRNERAKSGVGIIIHKRFKEAINNIEYVSDRILRVHIKLKEKEIHLITVYAPDISKATQDRRQFYEDLQMEIDRIPIQHYLVIMGDLNARIGDNPISGVMQRFNETAHNDNGDLLIDFCARNSFRINNTFFDHGGKYEYTFENAQGHRSVIDYIITNRKFHPREILDIRTLNSSTIGNGHKLVLGKVLLGSSKLQRKEKVTEKINIESIYDPTTRDLYRKRLEEKIKQDRILEEHNVDAAWKIVQTNILEAAQEALGKRKIYINKNRPYTTPWYTPEVKEIVQEKKTAFRKYMATRDKAEWEKYVKVRNETNIKIRQIKENYWEGFTKGMERDLYGSQKKMWKLLRNTKQEINDTLKLNSVSTTEWERYFGSLYDATGSDTESSDEWRNRKGDEVTMTLEDIKNAARNLKNRKAPGPDNISNELLKYGDEQLHEEITKLFNKIIRSGRIPNNWKLSTTIPIYKKGEKSKPENYRGITLLNSAQKLFTKIITEKLEAYIEINEEQQGFRRNRSATDAIFIIRQLTEKAIEYNTPAFLCFVDLQKAFDRVQLSDVTKTLAKYNVPVSLIQIIHHINSNTKTRIQVGSKLTSEILCSSGIRQGDSLSPALFNLIMKEITESLQDMKGYRMNNRQIKAVCYADDAILVADSEDNLQRLLYRFHLTAKIFNMTISTEKTKSMVIAKEPIRCKLEIERAMIEQVMEFKYLGAQISSQSNLYKEVRQQAQKGARISGCLRDIVWRNKYLSVESKTKIYKTIVRPVLCYAAETRAETSRTKQLMRTTEMNTLRAIAGKSRLDRVRNQEIREQCQIGDIVRFTKTRRKEWNNHVTRANDDRLIKIVRDGNPVGKRDAGRPRKRWIQSWQSTSTETP